MFDPQNPCTFVFDMDGTLADTNADLVPVLNRTIAPLGLEPLSAQCVGHTTGKGAKAMIQRAFDHNKVRLEEQVLEDLFKTFIADYEANLTTNTRLYDGAHSVIEKLRDQGQILAVCTNKMEHMAVKFLQELKLDHHFSAILGGNSLEWRKPDARHLFRTIEKAGGRRDKAIMIGDSVTDIDAAKNANIPVIAVDFGYSERPVHEYEPDVVISHYDELLAAAAKII